MELMEIINRHRRASEAHANPICPIYRLLLLVVQKHSPNTHIIYIETEFGEPTGSRYMRPQLTENRTPAYSEGANKKESPRALQTPRRSLQRMRTHPMPPQYITIPFTSPRVLPFLLAASCALGDLAGALFLFAVQGVRR